MTLSMLNSEHCIVSVFTVKRQRQRISKTCKAYSAVYEISKNGPIFLHLACQGVGGAHSCPTVSYATTHSRKVPPPPSHGLKQSQAFQEGIIS